jgi:hypothetical protein
MKKLLNWLAVGLLTTAFLEMMFFAMIGEPVPWLRDILMACGGVLAFWLMIKTA